MSSRWKPREEIWRKRSVNILALLVLGGVLYYLAELVEQRLIEAEEMAVNVMVDNLRSQLMIEQSTAMAALDRDRLRVLGGTDPMQLVDLEEEPPEDYIGACPEDEAPKAGTWCFEGRDGVGVLWYYPRFDIEVDGVAGDPERFGWRLVVELDDRDEPLRLEPVHP